MSYYYYYLYVGKSAIDKEAAGRFIKHALVHAQNAAAANEPTTAVSSGADTTTDAGVRAAQVPVKITSKMAARAEYERRLREEADDVDDGGGGEEQEEELEVFDEAPIDDLDDAPAKEVEVEVEATPRRRKKDKGKGRDVVPSAPPAKPQPVQQQPRAQSSPPRIQQPVSVQRPPLLPSPLVRS